MQVRHHILVAKLCFWTKAYFNPSLYLYSALWTWECQFAPKASVYGGANFLLHFIFSFFAVSFHVGQSAGVSPQLH
jgi:hypothetical protein